jgi:L,D-transpeptidase YcbB
VNTSHGDSILWSRQHAFDRAGYRTIVTLRGLGLLLIFATFVDVAGQNKPPSTIANSGQSPSRKLNSTANVQSIVRSGRLVDLRWPIFSDVQSDVDTFYRASGYSLVWIRDGKVTERSHAIIEVLLQADGEGLRVEDYDGPRWAERLTQLENPHKLGYEARFDVALTVCAMRYFSAVRVGRINPNHLRFGFDVEHKRLNLPQFLRQVLADSANVTTEVEQVEPPFRQYKLLRETLSRYDELAKQDHGEQLPRPPGILFPGGPYPGMERLASLLRLVGDLPKDAIVPADAKIYDEPLVTAVKRFQERHGLPANGYLTVDTVNAMNVPLSSRVEQIRLTMERYRWVPYSFPEPPVVVNIPEFRLYAFAGGGRVGLAMKVNVGDAYDFQTPVFENTIRYLVFRPYWNVPPKILRNEVIPDIEDDRSYIKDNDMEVTTHNGQVVATGVISDGVLQQLRAGKLTVRQKPGPENALGLLKVMFPNEHHVYLHDTPEGGDMFSDEQRALSHGCIHLEHPAELAAWLLKDKPGWNLERAEEAMHQGRDNITVALTRPVPILIVYGTAIVEANGEAHFHQDIYGHDAALEEALAKGYPYPKRR